MSVSYTHLDVYKRQLIGHTVKEGERVFCEVSPMLVPDENPLSNVEDVFNAITVKGDSIGEVIFYGKGAGKMCIRDRYRAVFASFPRF